MYEEFLSEARKKELREGMDADDLEQVEWCAEMLREEGFEELAKQFDKVNQRMRLILDVPKGIEWE